MGVSKVRILFLIRHAEPETAGGKIYLGQGSDPGLSTNGKDQCRRLARALRSQRIEAVYCSDLKRARETAEAIAQPHGMKTIPLAGLRELDMGTWEGMSHEAVKRLFPGEYEARGKDIVHYCPPHGESFEALADRACAAFLRAVKATEGNLAFVAHAGVNRTILCRLAAHRLDDLFTIRQDYAAVNTVLFNGTDFIIRSVNRVF